MEGWQNRIEYFERMVAENPDNPTGLLALANEYGKAERFEDEAVTLERYVAQHEDERTARQHTSQHIKFRAPLTGEDAGRIELVSA
ncbi:MAG: hypothetical protein M3N10_07365 [Actinomycetota bacterium]|nr:hypothetical protein [Actinomycetota bacterium]